MKTEGDVTRVDTAKKESKKRSEHHEISEDEATI